jgi:hypothetical protein
MRVANSAIRTDVRGLGDRGLRATGGSALTLNRRPEAPAPECTGSEISAVRVTDSYDALARPSRVSRRVDACPARPEALVRA